MATLTAEHKPYPDYKPSGVDWLGYLPAHWKVARLKSHVANIADQTDECGADEVYLALENVESWTGKLREVGKDISFDSQVKRFQVGDVLFGKLRPYLAKVTSPNCNGVCVSEFLVLRGRSDGLMPKYLEYLLLSRPIIDAINSATFGAKMPRADWQFMGGMIQPFPPLAEQRAIAAFLDRETGKIDALVSKKERLIELLQEKRTALINHTVTKGLNPDAPMKDSGIEWLGAIPAHWNIRRVKWIADLNPNSTKKRTSLSADTPVTFLPMGRVGTEGQIDTREKVEASQVWNGYTYFRRGDILVAKITPCFENGKGAYLNSLPTEVGFGSTEFHVLRAKPSVHPLFLYRITTDFAFRQRGTESMTGAAGQQRVSADFVADYQVSLPPLDEQAAIAAFLDRETARLDNFVAKVHDAIKLLKELKTALISAAVTGKIDVREETVCT